MCRREDRSNGDRVLHCAHASMCNSNVQSLVGRNWPRDAISLTQTCSAHALNAPWAMLACKALPSQDLRLFARVMAGLMRFMGATLGRISDYRNAADLNANSFS